jgi:hypothetical protein
MMILGSAAIDAAEMAALRGEAEADLTSFRGRLTADEYARAREAAVQRLVRERLQLPTLRFA